MSCNGCRVLRKGCNENCILRESLQGIINHTPQAQANATVFVAKFFGRAGLMSFLAAVPQSQRSALFQSLLFEACGRTVNPVNGAVGLLWTGNWHVCQAAVDTVLRGGELCSSPDFLSGSPVPESESDGIDLFGSSTRDLNESARYDFDDDEVAEEQPSNLDLSLASELMTAGGSMKRRPPSEESETTTLESGLICNNNQRLQGERKLLRLFV